ncbi:unnamed protein product, partial [Urochloa humidicola]
NGAAAASERGFRCRRLQLPPRQRAKSASQVDCLFKEYVARREGLIKAFDSGLDSRDTCRGKQEGRGAHTI